MNRFDLNTAKFNVAKRHGYNSWFEIDFYQMDSNNHITSEPYSEEILRDEVAFELARIHSNKQLLEYKQVIKDLLLFCESDGEVKNGFRTLGIIQKLRSLITD